MPILAKMTLNLKMVARTLGAPSQAHRASTLYVCFCDRCLHSAPLFWACGFETRTPARASPVAPPSPSFVAGTTAETAARCFAAPALHTASCSLCCRINLCVFASPAHGRRPGLRRQ